MDGTYEPGLPQNDTKLANWDIKVYNDVDNSNTLTAVDTLEASGSTDGSGNYSFTLDPGEYVVCEVAQDADHPGVWTQSAPVNAICAFDATLGAGGYAITITSGSTDSDNLFGNFLVPPGCSLTQGYWKTHSIYGPAAHPDDTWLLITAAMTGGSFGSGPDSEFFDTGLTWYQVFWTNPKGGNAYFILAHQYMAAILNQLNGAGNPAGLATNLANAYILLDYYDEPPHNNNIPKNEDNVLVIGTKDRAEAIAIAGYLAQYNEGTLEELGAPTHCGEENFAGFGLNLNFVLWPIGLAPLAARVLRRRRD
jgi:hypothetical protein